MRCCTRSPPLWYYPLRHSLGRALLEAGNPQEAERVYREDLLRFPDNGWSLFGAGPEPGSAGQGRVAVEAGLHESVVTRGCDAPCFQVLITEASRPFEGRCSFRSASPVPAQRRTTKV